MNQKFLDAGLENAVITILSRFPFLADQAENSPKDFVLNVSRLVMVPGVKPSEYLKLMSIK